VARVTKGMTESKDAVMLVVDHQSGLFQPVKDSGLPRLRAHAGAFAKGTPLAKLPTFTTDSVSDGPKGPLIPQIHNCNPDICIPRTGRINARDNPAGVKGMHFPERDRYELACRRDPESTECRRP
jgi:hypothetical protein